MRAGRHHISPEPTKPTRIIYHSRPARGPAVAFGRAWKVNRCTAACRWRSSSSQRTMSLDHLCLLSLQRLPNPIGPVLESRQSPKPKAVRLSVLVSVHSCTTRSGLSMASLFLDNPMPSTGWQNDSWYLAPTSSNPFLPDLGFRLQYLFNQMPRPKR